MKLRETIMKLVFLIAACCSVLAVALICIFLFMNGVPAIFKIGPLKFLTGTVWKPGNNIFGILPMIEMCIRDRLPEVRARLPVFASVLQQPRDLVWQDVYKRQALSCGRTKR